MDGREKRMMVVSPHADDELFGAGGLLLRRANEGWDFRMILVSNSDIDFHHAGEIDADTRESEFRASVDRLTDGRGEVEILGYPESLLDTEPVKRLTTELDRQIAEFRPNVLLMPEPGYHQDHQYVCRATTAALRPTGGWQVGRVLAYEIPTGTWSGMYEMFDPNYWVDISEVQDQKEEVLRDAYPSQYTETDRGKLALEGMRQHAKYRGTEIGADAAEAFMIIREVEG